MGIFGTASLCAAPSEYFPGSSTATARCWRWRRPTGSNPQALGGGGITEMVKLAHLAEGFGVS